MDFGGNTNFDISITCASSLAEQYTSRVVKMTYPGYGKIYKKLRFSRNFVKIGDFQ